MIAQLNNYSYIVRWGNIKNIIYFILYLCAFKLAPDMVLYKYSKGVDLITINHEN